LLEEFLNPMGLSQNRLAVNIGVPARRINEIVLEKRKVTADTALRLGRFFGMSLEFWLGLQSQYDLDVADDALVDYGR
jgi:addiction module HigA family antidote